jgi:hypothetical protein
LQEGGAEGVLPRQEQKVAAVATMAAPLASFTRSNSGWMVNVSLPEAATQIGYRVGEGGKFTDTGFLDVLDQRTGQRSPRPISRCPPDQALTMIYITWRDKRGEQAEVFPIHFDPPGLSPASRNPYSSNSGRAGSPSARGTAGWSISPLITYRCAIKEVHYGFDDAAVDKVFKLPPCDPFDQKRAGERHDLPEGTGKDRLDGGQAHLYGRDAVGDADF